MKIVSTFFVVALLAGLWTCKRTPEPGRKSARNEVATAADSLAAAISRHDAEGVSKHLSRHAGALHIIDGRLIPQARLRKALAEFMDGLREISFAYEKRDVRVLGPDSALLTAWTHCLKTDLDGKKAEERAILSLVYRRERDHWRIFQSHKSPLRSFPRSETSKARPRLSPFCRGNGVDLGYGGDPITPSAITLDLPAPYTKLGDHPQNLAGDARDLYWFKDGVLDYVYSSHLLEDFSPGEMTAVIREWFRVIKTGGFMVIYSPDEQAYRAYCGKRGEPPNPAHKIDDFGLKYLKGVLERNFRDRYVIEHEIELVDDYGFDLVLRKLS